jgi:hypothetical protein
LVRACVGGCRRRARRGVKTAPTSGRCVCEPEPERERERARASESERGERERERGTREREESGGEREGGRDREAGRQREGRRAYVCVHYTYKLSARALSSSLSLSQRERGSV